MKHVLAALVVMFATSSCLFTDSRYEGSIKRCDETSGSSNALLVMDNPRGPTGFTGWWGYAADDQRDTWSMAEITSGESSLSGLNFKVEYEYSSGDANSTFHSETTSSWKVELTPSGNGSWEGTARIETTTRSTAFGNTTTNETTNKCDVELEQATD